MKTYKIPGQIMVIVLLVLSILSIFVIVVVSNTRKDLVEKVQNKQYQQYYSINEKKLLQVQGAIGTKPLSATDPKLDALREAGEPACTGTSIITCTYTEKGVELETGTGDTASLRVTIEDSGSLTNFALKQDQNLSMDLNGYTGIVNASFSNNIILVVAVDYISAGEYKVIKEVKDPFGVAGAGGLYTNESHCYPGTNFADANRSFSFSIATLIQSCTGLAAGSYTPVSLRFKPIGNETALSVSGGAGFPEQFRNITGVAYSSANPSSPVTVLELSYPLTTSPLGILDYVLRTNDGPVSK